MLVGGIALALVAVYLIRLYHMSKSGTLPYSRLTGLRTRAIMRSEPVWIKVHERYAWVFLSTAAGFAMIGLWFIVSAFFATLQQITMILFYVISGATLITLISGGTSADRYARTINSGGEAP